MEKSLLTTEGATLHDQLRTARLRRDACKDAANKEAKIHVAGIGKTISSAYEHLRIAAENTEEHLLLERAIRRFYIRNVSFHVRKAPEPLAEELIVELTHAGYLENGSIPTSFVERIDGIIARAHTTYWKLRDHKTSASTAIRWVLDEASVETEDILVDGRLEYDVLVHFSYEHYKKLFAEELKADAQPNFDLSLYVATHRVLLRSDMAIVRRTLLHLYQKTPEDIADYIAFNTLIDKTFSSDFTLKCMRRILKYAAPLRIIKSMIHDNIAVDELMEDRNRFLGSYAAQLQREYESVGSKIKRGVIKSIIFLFITKVIIGLLIEVPYDLMIYGMIPWMPLIINILFPPLYMASLKWSLKLPGAANREATEQYADGLLFVEATQLKYADKKRATPRTQRSLGALYVFMFVISFGLVALLLAWLGFNIVQGLIFVIFLSTASFLGFRLSRLVRELEMFSTKQTFLGMVQDFIYTPFVVVGRWLSEKYSRVNIITLILDMAIELPLKTFLRLTRQWTRFLNDKRDEM